MMKMCVESRHIIGGADAQVIGGNLVESSNWLRLYIYNTDRTYISLRHYTEAYKEPLQLILFFFSF